MDRLFICLFTKSINLIDINPSSTNIYSKLRTFTTNPDNSNQAGSQMVRVPRNIINLVTNIKIPRSKNLDISLIFINHQNHRI